MAETTNVHSLYLADALEYWNDSLTAGPSETDVNTSRLLARLSTELRSGKVFSTFACCSPVVLLEGDCSRVAGESNISSIFAAALDAYRDHFDNVLDRLRENGDRTQFLSLGNKEGILDELIDIVASHCPPALPTIPLPRESSVISLDALRDKLQAKLAVGFLITITNERTSWSKPSPPAGWTKVGMHCYACFYACPPKGHSDRKAAIRRAGDEATRTFRAWQESTDPSHHIHAVITRLFDHSEVLADPVASDEYVLITPTL
ncbi:hypothetical protein PAPYR_5502 [Paratrimastix pyriformis]|uniref:Uncharacterized protein n=1 Tax=Paratrimastix pyriformis TaxID=342808 RepID=A0ABQ8UJZ5_9EUKA|nr:hypothetical protein PAPYR_5502 [Paratrimastix pyriformis]